ncbi:MAG TPA: phage late control D family protein [bacterium (Candidatus Stahlbacteria)]|nr:phage late control D family protein [Candidatus Stahlbacteria bacterium]
MSDVAEIEIIIDGETIESNYFQVEHLKVDLSSEIASLFSLTITNVINNQLELVTPWVFKMGTRIKIRAGYPSDLEDLMDGIITSVTYHYADEEHLTIEVEGCDLLFLLMKQYRQRSFSEMSDSEVVTEVLRDYGLESDIEDSEILYNHIQQDHESDFSFVSRLAKRNGFEFYNRGETIYFKSPAVESSPSEVFTFGVDPITVNCRHDITHLFERVHTHGWDRLNKEPVEEESNIVDVSSVESQWQYPSASISRLGLSDIVYSLSENYENSQSAQREADAMMQKFAYTLVKVKGSLRGLATLTPATVIELNGFSQVHNGKYYLTHVIHRIGENQGFTTHFEMRGDRIHESL